MISVCRPQILCMHSSSTKYPYIVPYVHDIRLFPLSGLFLQQEHRDFLPGRTLHMPVCSFRIKPIEHHFFDFNLRRNLILHSGSNRSLSWRELKYVHLVQIKLRQIIHRLPKLFFRLPRESYDHIRSQCRAVKCLRSISHFQSILHRYTSCSSF